MIVESKTMDQNPKDFCLALVSEAGRNWPGDTDHRVLCECAAYVAESKYADQIDPTVALVCDLATSRRRNT